MFCFEKNRIKVFNKIQNKIDYQSLDLNNGEIWISLKKEPIIDPHDYQIY